MKRTRIRYLAAGSLVGGSLIGGCVVGDDPARPVPETAPDGVASELPESSLITAFGGVVVATYRHEDADRAGIVSTVTREGELALMLYWDLDTGVITYQRAGEAEWIELPSLDRVTPTLELASERAFEEWQRLNPDAPDATDDNPYWADCRFECFYRGCEPQYCWRWVCDPCGGNDCLCENRIIECGCIPQYECIWVCRPT